MPKMLTEPIRECFHSIYATLVDLTYFNSIKRLIFLMEIVQKATFFGLLRKCVCLKCQRTQTRIVIKRTNFGIKMLPLPLRLQMCLLGTAGVSLQFLFQKSESSVVWYHTHWIAEYCVTSESSDRTKTATNRENQKVNVNLMFTLD